MRKYTTEEFMKSNKNLHIFRCGSTSAVSDVSVHTHEFIEIVYVLSGEMVHEIDGCRYNTARGDMLFMNYGCTHAFSSESTYTYVNILFSPELMADAVITTQNAFPCSPSPLSTKCAPRRTPGAFVSSARSETKSKR